MKRSFLWALLLVLASIGYAQAQSTITGKITNARTGEPVPFVTVIVKGAETGITSGDDGSYSIAVPANAVTLIFSSIGFDDLEQEIGGRSVINPLLAPSAESLDEVIVVAYGTATRSSFTGSASSLKSEKLAMRTASNITNALSGQLSGVQVINSGGGQPGATSAIRIRGVGSMSSSNNPLYVVDGVPIESTLINSINPQDIESMTVLKDAAANAIYGARGANGVILITTKRANSKDAVVTMSAKWGTNSRAVPNYDVMTDPAMYYETFYQSMYNSRLYAGQTSAQAYEHADKYWLDPNNGGLGYQIYTVPNGEKIIGTNFKLNPNATLGYTDGDYYYLPDNWYNEVFNNNNLRQEYNVSVAGGTDKMNVYVSGSFLDDSGIIPNSGFERYTGMAKVDYQAKDWLKVGANMAYAYYNLHTPGSQTINDWASSGNLFYVSNMMAPIYPMYVRNPDGTVRVDNNGITVYDFGGTSTNFKRPFMSMANPGVTLELNKYDARTDVVNNKWYAILTPIDGLTITANIGANVYNRRRNQLGNPFYGSSVGSQGWVAVDHNRDFAVNQQYLAAYKKKFANHHTVEVKAGYEGYSLKMQYLGGENTKLFNPWVPELGNAIETPPSVNSYTYDYKTQGILSIAQYDYDGKYFLSGSYRRDASSRFHPDNRWGNFGSIGGAWLMTKENFMQGVSWVDMLKFKASYGIQGNDRLLPDPYSYYAYLDQYTVSNSDGDFAVSFAYKGNKDITWETSYAFNTGFDFGLFDNRLSGTIEFYSRTTKDLLYLQPVPVSAGFSSFPTNVGSILNSGLELELSGVIVKTKDIEWSLNTNITYLKNKIKSLDPDIEAKGGQKTSNAIYKVGGSLYNSYLRMYAGVDKETGKATYYKDPDNNDWTIIDDYQAAAQADLGTTHPKFYGGFGTQLNAFGFDLSIQFSYQLGGKYYDGTYEELMHSGDNEGINWHKDILKSWTTENPNSEIPRLNNTDISIQQQSSRFLINSNFLSLNNVTLGYTLPKKWMDKIKISNIRVYLTGENLALFSKRKGFDPRFGMGLGSSTTSGSYAYSILRSISGGISFTF